MKLNHVLARTTPVTIDLDSYHADVLKKAARFWIGTEASTMRKGDCILALEKALNDSSSGQKALSSLSDKPRQVLSIFARYGPRVSGALLSAELHGRKLVTKDENKPGSYSYRRRDETITNLISTMVLINSGYSSYYYGFSDGRYPEMTLHPILATSIQPAAPLLWNPSETSPTVKSSYRRSSAEVALDLWEIATELREMGSWKPVKGGSLSKGSRNRLKKQVPLDSAEKDPLFPPDPESLYYELLRGMGYLDLRTSATKVLHEKLEQHLCQPAAVQAWHWVRAWLQMELWQDGIGVVPDRDSDYDPARIRIPALHKARELLVWALCRIAHGPHEWLDLEAFLQDLWKATKEDEIEFFWGSYTWHLRLEMAKQKNSFPIGDQRSLAFWLDDEGNWAANAVMVTLVTLGLVERGGSAEKRSKHCFRLTELGREVFGAPEIEIAPQSRSQDFLTVQPNLEVLAYLDRADAGRICTLQRFSARTSKAGGQVQTFALQRESVYQALESGMTLEAITSFLTDHGKTPLPDNVARMLSEWAGKRESLVLRTQVTLACGTGLQPGKQGRTLRDGMTLLPKMSSAQAAKNYPRWTVLDHQGTLPRTWTADELGKIRIKKDDSIAKTRLSYIADGSGKAAQITDESIARARQIGLNADRILRWLQDHLTHALPPLLEIAIRNRIRRTSVFCGNVRMLQVPHPQARDAILGSRLFEPLLAGHIPPDWFVVRDEKAAELEALLESLGFSVGRSPLSPPLEELRGNREGR